MRELGKHALESRRISGPEVRRYLHPSENDSHIRVFRFCLVDDRLEICFPRFQVQPAQTIVRTELDDENVDRALEQPVDSAQATGARVAAQTSVLNCKRPIR